MKQEHASATHDLYMKGREMLKYWTYGVWMLLAGASGNSLASEQLNAAGEPMPPGIIVFSARTESALAGYDPTTGLSFSSSGPLEGSFEVKIYSPTKAFSFSVRPGMSGGFEVVSGQLTTSGSEPRSKTEADQRNLEGTYGHFVNELQNAVQIEHYLTAVAHGLVMLVPVNEDWPEEATVLEATGLGYSTICDSRGRMRDATFDAWGLPLTRSVRIGDPESSCQGRCGSGCYGLLGLERQYTQDCLNHDACVGSGAVLTGCADEMLAAFDDLEAPNCQHSVVGSWWIYADWKCDGSADSRDASVESDGSFVLDDLTGGSWELTNETAWFHYYTGSEYTGKVDAFDMNMNRTMVGPLGLSTGCWRARKHKM